MQDIISNFESLSTEDISNYPGEWVAILNNKIVAHNKSFKELHNLIKSKYPKERALMGKLPELIPTVLSIG